MDLAPQSPEPYFCLSELDMLQGRIKDAIERMNHVLELDCEYPGAHARIGALMLRIGKRDKAIGHFLTELRICDDDVVMLKEIAFLLRRAGHMRYLNTVLWRLSRLLPDDPQIQHNLAVSYFKLGRFQQGIYHCRKAVKLRPKYLLALYNLSLGYMKLADMECSRRYAATALTLCPDDARVLRLVGRIGNDGFWSSLRRKLGIS